MSKERLYLYDTTLRDGQQTQGVQFSTAEKVQIAKALDELGVDYIEGGWPGANPTDSAFFEVAPKTSARLTAFGMTKRSGRSAENDDVLAAVMSGVLLLSVSLAVIALFRKQPYLLFGWLWFLITLLPVIGVIQVGTQSMADRYTYIPLIGIFTGSV